MGFIKYPRTYHLPNSEGVSSDDKIISSLDSFKGKRVIATLKMDGENTSLYNHGLHARSLNQRPHKSRDLVKQLQARLADQIPDGYRICGENLFAKHSIHYQDLKDYFQVFSIWNENLCLSWDQTQDQSAKLGLSLVDVIYDGIFDLKEIEKAFGPYKKDHEGYVVRIADSFEYNRFNECVAKYVRKNHVQTDTHWMNAEIIKNKLKKSGDF